MNLRGAETTELASASSGSADLVGKRYLPGGEIAAQKDLGRDSRRQRQCIGIGNIRHDNDQGMLLDVERTRIEVKVVTSQKARHFE